MAYSCSLIAQIEGFVDEGARVPATRKWVEANPMIVGSGMLSVGILLLIFTLFFRKPNFFLSWLRCFLVTMVFCLAGLATLFGYTG